MAKKDYDLLSVKVALGMINFCINMATMRKDATDSALKYLVSNIDNRKAQLALGRECKFSFKNEDIGEEKMVESTKCNNPKLGRAVNNIVSCIEVENVIDEFDLDKVLNETYDDDSGDLTFGELVKAETFLNPEEENVEEKKDSGMRMWLEY